MPDILTRLKFFMIAPRIKRRRDASPTLVAPCYTGQPLSFPLRDDEIVDRARLEFWTMTEALFWLGGYRSPGYESTRHMQDHFFDAYTRAVIEIEGGVLCQKKVRAGETIFYDTPENWLAWADRIGAEDIEVDDRMRRALSQMADTPDGTAKEEPPKAAITAGGPSSVDRPRLKAATEKSWTQDRTDYWVNRAKEITKKSSRLSLAGIAKKIESEDAPDHLSDDQSAAWKKKGWTFANIHRRLKGRL